MFLRSVAMLAARISASRGCTSKGAPLVQSAAYAYLSPRISPAFGCPRLWSAMASPRGAAPPAGPVGVYQQEYPRSSEEAFIGEVEFSPSLANSLSLIGNVGQPPELKFLEGGNKVLQMRLAFKDRKDAETQWVDIEAWGPLAERAYAEVGRGQQVAVQGRLRIQDWTDKQGMKRKSIRMVANSISKVRSAGGYNNSGGVSGANSWASPPQQQQQQQQRRPAAEQAAAAAEPWASVPSTPDYTTPAATSAPAGQANTAEELWMSFFEDPSGWYDNRPGKASGATNAKAPDFKRKEGGREAPALWVDSRGTPAWVMSELDKLDRMNASLPPF